jgi:biotin carboxyl carrier protein
MKLRSAADGREREVQIVAREGSRVRLAIDGREVVAEVNALSDGAAVVSIDGRRFRVFAVRRKAAIAVAVGPQVYELIETDESAPHRAHGLLAPEVTAPMPGKVLKILVREGQAVEAGDTLLVLEAMKMETELSAESAALVKRVAVAEGEMVDHGALLIELSPVPSPRESAPPGA